MSVAPVTGNRDQHLEWLLQITQLPTAAGREWRVIAWIRAWVAQRPDLTIKEDRAGNLLVQPKRLWGAGGRSKGTGPVLITAHMDHPAFVVERVIGPGTLELSFRGGVMDVYFKDARVVVHAECEPGASSGAPRAPARIAATLTGEGSGVAGPDGSRLFATYIAELDDAGEDVDADVRPGDVATWEMPAAEFDAQGLVHTAACDDLAALAAALGAMDTLRQLRAQGQKLGDVRLLFTRSEEIGFTGAIAACRLGTIPKGSRIIALENSRAFPESPIGGGPIVRVGDRLTIFDPRLTGACAKRAEEIAGHAATPTASQRHSDLKGWKWQRKLMAGGACEATVFCAFGHSATCLCLPLGNYHNMANLAEVQAGTYDPARMGPARAAREYIHRDDYLGMIDLLVAIGQHLPESESAMGLVEKLYRKTRGVIGMSEDANGAIGKKKTPGAKARRSPRSGSRGKSNSRKPASRRAKVRA